jgi:hypothetical protein
VRRLIKKKFIVKIPYKLSKALNACLFMSHSRSFASIRGSLISLQNDSFPFELRVLEVDQQANLQPRNFQIVQHLPDFVITDLVNRLCVNNDLFKTD